MPSRIGALPWARTRGAARADARTAPAPAELLMKVRRETRAMRGLCFFIVALPSRRITEAAAVILSVTGRKSLEEICKVAAFICRAAILRRRPRSVMD